MSRPPRIRIVIDRVVVRAGEALSEASVRHELARGLAQALATRTVAVRGEQRALRVESSAAGGSLLGSRADPRASTRAAGAALGEAIGGEPGHGEPGARS